MNKNTPLGKYLLKKLVDCDSTRADLASDLGVSKSHISELFLGRKKVSSKLESLLTDWLYEHDLLDEEFNLLVMCHNGRVDLTSLPHEHKMLVIRIVSLLSTGTEEQKNKILSILKESNNVNDGSGVIRKSV
jgi:transcriptional regulator with XRE-family HTH domain